MSVSIVLVGMNGCITEDVDTRVGNEVIEGIVGRYEYQEALSVGQYRRLVLMGQWKGGLFGGGRMIFYFSIVQVHFDFC